MTHGCHTAAIRSPYGESYLHDPLTRDNKTAVADDRNGLVDFDTCRVEPSLEGTEPPSPPPATNSAPFPRGHVGWGRGVM